MDKILKQVAKKHNLKKKQVSNIYKLYWQAIKNHLEQLPTNATEEQFINYRPSVSIPYIGKIYSEWSYYLQRNKYGKAKHNKD